MFNPRCRILIVDDHIPIRDALRDLLKSYDDILIVGEAGNGQEAIDMVESCQPDVVLLDIYMPKMNGIEAANEIKKLWENTIIIGLTIVHDTYTNTAFLKAGASAVISKDRLDQLYSTIERACSTKIGDQRSV